MRSIVPLVSHPAAFLLLPGVVLVALFATLQGVPDDADGYWVGITSSATLFMVFSCVLPATAAAWVGGRVRRGRVLAQAPVRSSLAVAASLLWPVIVLGIVLQSFGFLLASYPTWGAPGRFPVEVLGAWLAMILVHVSGGYLLGCLLPGVVAVPASMVISYVWLGFTWGSSFIPLRYLAGLAMAGCCPVQWDLAWQAPLTVTVFSLATAAAIALSVRELGAQRRSVLRMLGALSIVAIATPSALYLARDLQSYPTVPRAASALVCEEAEGVTICLFPEQQAASDGGAAARQVMVRVIAQLRGIGVEVPTRVTAAISDTTDGAVVVTYRTSFSEPMIVTSLVSSLVPQRHEGEPCPRDDGDVGRYLHARGVAQRVLLSMAGAQSAADAETQHDVDDLLSQPSSAQVAWINETVAALRDCSREYPAVGAP